MADSTEGLPASPKAAKAAKTSKAANSSSSNSSSSSSSSKGRAKAAKTQEDTENEDGANANDGTNEVIENKESESFSQIGVITEYKPGQKYPTPAPANGDRVFYESLLSQRPNSEMAQEWCVVYGILEENEASRVYKLICKRKGVTPASPMKIKKESTPVKGSKKPDKKPVSKSCISRYYTRL
jgi:hypothetical protein